MNKSLSKFLNKYRVNDVFHTHVSMIEPKGRFGLNREALEEFWEQYSNIIENENVPILGIAEKPHPYLPILVDIDIKIKVEDDDIFEEKLYTEEQVKQVIEVYQSVLRKIVDECTDQQLLCVLLEKDMYTITKNDITYVKHGFHLHFPYLFLSRVNQEVHLIPRVQEIVNELKIFENLGFENSGDLIDGSCCKVPWLLYGSRKDDTKQPYKVTKIYDSTMKCISLEKAFKNYQLFDHKERLIKIKNKVKYYLPRILSIVPCARQTNEVKHGLISPLKEKIKERTKKQHGSTYVNKSIKEQIKIAKEILPMLSDFRAQDYNEWMTVGWALYNISNGNADGLDLWCSFSSRNEDKFDEGQCIHLWERMVKKDITLGTLRYYASIDNPEEYKKFKEKQAEKHIKESLQGSHNDIAKILYAEYGDEFVCVSISKKIWYQFINHKWEETEMGVELSKKISDEIIKRFTNAGKELFIKLGEVTDKAEEALINSRIKMVQKMTGNLKTAGFKSSVMKEAMEVFYNKNFQQKLDKNPYLFAFNNGVYDLKLNIFRPGRPEDYISNSAPIDYIEYTEDDEKVQEIYSFFEKIFPDKSLRIYFMDISSDVFVGGNIRKEMYLWTGDGDNGKSVTQSFFEKMLGKLAVKLTTTILTGKKVGAGGANADLARTGDGVRWVIMEEPNKDEQINVGPLKHLTGNDSYFARDLFQQGKGTREIVPMYKMALICNELPVLKHADKAVWNRIRVIPFESTFCRPTEPAPETWAEQLNQKRFPMDKEFSLKIPGLLSAFAWVLLEHRKRIKVRIEPEKVLIATEIYRKKNDLYRQFLEEYIIEDKSKYISLQELYSQFKEWYRESFPNHTIPIRGEIEEYFTKLWGTSENGKKWKGYRFRTLNDDIEEGNAIIIGDDELINYDEEENCLPPI